MQNTGAAFAGGASVGTAISMAKARAAISPFMIRLHLRAIVLGFGISAWPDRAGECGRKMPAPGLLPCDAGHNFRTIQNDSE
jgi:hypothetical protein